MGLAKKLRQFLFGFPSGKTAQRAVFLSLPLFLLLSDYLSFPRIWEDYHSEHPVVANSLLEHPSVSAGVFHGHQISVSLDNITSADFLSDLPDAKNGLAVSCFLQSGTNGLMEGDLVRAVNIKLDRVAPDDRERLRDLLSSRTPRRAGDIVPFSLQVPQASQERFPINHLFIMVFEQQNSDRDDEILSKGLSNLVGSAEEQGLSTLVFPCICYTWRNNHSVSLAGLFEPLFKALADDDKILNIRVSLYADWPTSVVEDAVNALNSAREKAASARAEESPILYRQDLRLILVFLIACLAISSLYTRLNLKNFLIIAVGFAGLALASKELIELFARGYSPAAHFGFKLAVWAVLALGFPFIVRWDPKDLFKRGGGE